MALVLVSATSTEATAITTFAEGIDYAFPKSDIFVVTKQLMYDKGRSDVNEINCKFMRGATEYGCVHSMFMLGFFYSQSELNGRQLHKSQPMLLEGAIRGSSSCANNLIGQIVYEAKPNTPKALAIYWGNMCDAYAEWSGRSDLRYDTKNHVGIINRECIVCNQGDTATLTLRQCIGRSTYCYCKYFVNKRGRKRKRNHSKYLFIVCTIIFYSKLVYIFIRQ